MASAEGSRFKPFKFSSSSSKPPPLPPKDPIYQLRANYNRSRSSLVPDSPISPDAQYAYVSSFSPSPSGVSASASASASASQSGSMQQQNYSSSPDLLLSPQSSSASATGTTITKKEKALGFLKFPKRSPRSPPALPTTSAPAVMVIGNGNTDDTDPLPPPPQEDDGISLPWNFQHNIHVDEGYVGLPPSWSTSLSEAGFTDDEIAAIHTRRAAGVRSPPDMRYLYNERPQSPSMLGFPRLPHQQQQSSPLQQSQQQGQGQGQGVPILTHPTPRSTSLPRLVPLASSSSSVSLSNSLSPSASSSPPLPPAAVFSPPPPSNNTRANANANLPSSASTPSLNASAAAAAAVSAVNKGTRVPPPKRKPPSPYTFDGPATTTTNASSRGHKPNQASSSTMGHSSDSHASSSNNNNNNEPDADLTTKTNFTNMSLSEAYNYNPPSFFNAPPLPKSKAAPHPYANPANSIRGGVGKGGDGSDNEDEDDYEDLGDSRDKEDSRAIQGDISRNGLGRDDTYDGDEDDEESYYGDEGDEEGEEEDDTPLGRMKVRLGSESTFTGGTESGTGVGGSLAGGGTRFRVVNGGSGSGGSGVGGGAGQGQGQGQGQNSGWEDSAGAGAGAGVASGSGTGTPPPLTTITTSTVASEKEKEKEKEKKSIWGTKIVSSKSKDSNSNSGHGHGRGLSTSDMSHTHASSSSSHLPSTSAHSGLLSGLGMNVVASASSPALATNPSASSSSNLPQIQIQTQNVNTDASQYQSTWKTTPTTTLSFSHASAAASSGLSHASAAASSGFASAVRQGGSLVDAVRSKIVSVGAKGKDKDKDKEEGGKRKSKDKKDKEKKKGRSGSRSKSRDGSDSDGGRGGKGGKKGEVDSDEEFVSLPMDSPPVPVGGAGAGLGGEMTRTPVWQIYTRPRAGTDASLGGSPANADASQVSLAGGASSSRVYGHGPSASTSLSASNLIQTQSQTQTQGQPQTNTITRKPSIARSLKSTASQGSLRSRLGRLVNPNSNNASTSASTSASGSAAASAMASRNQSTTSLNNLNMNPGYQRSVGSLHSQGHSQGQGQGHSNHSHSHSQSYSQSNHSHSHSHSQSYSQSQSQTQTQAQSHFNQTRNGSATSLESIPEQENGINTNKNVPPLPDDAREVARSASVRRRDGRGVNGGAGDSGTSASSGSASTGMTGMNTTTKKATALPPRLSLHQSSDSTDLSSWSEALLSGISLSGDGPGLGLGLSFGLGVDSREKEREKEREERSREARERDLKELRDRERELRDRERELRERDSPMTVTTATVTARPWDQQRQPSQTRKLPSSKPPPSRPIPAILPLQRSRSNSKSSSSSSPSEPSRMGSVPPTVLVALPPPPPPPKPSMTSSSSTTAPVVASAAANNLLSPPPTAWSTTNFSGGDTSVVSPAGSSAGPDSGQLWGEIERMMDPGMMSAIPGLHLSVALPAGAQGVLRSAGLGPPPKLGARDNVTVGEGGKTVGDMVGTSPVSVYAPGEEEDDCGYEEREHAIEVQQEDSELYGGYLEDEDDDIPLARLRHAKDDTITDTRLLSVSRDDCNTYSGRDRDPNNRDSSRSSSSTLTVTALAAATIVRNASVARRAGAYVVDKSRAAAAAERARERQANGGSVAETPVEARHPPASPLSSHFGGSGSEESGGTRGTGTTASSHSISTSSSSPQEEEEYQLQPTPTTDGGIGSPLLYYLDGTQTPSPTPDKIFAGARGPSKLTRDYEGYEEGYDEEEEYEFAGYPDEETMEAEALAASAGSPPPSAASITTTSPGGTSSGHLPRPTIIISSSPSLDPTSTSTSTSASTSTSTSTPLSTTTSNTTPLSPFQRYRGWLSTIVAPLEEFIDEAVDPREHYLDLTEIAEGESGSVFAARVNPAENVRGRLRLPPLIKARDADEMMNGRVVMVAIKSVAIVPSGSPKLVDLQRELSLMRGGSGSSDSGSGGTGGGGGGVWAHENILTMDSVYVDLVEDSLWVRMELMERSLADIIALVSHGLQLQERTMARFASDVLCALEFLQRRGVAHCDVRSDNLLVNRNGVLKLADFSNAVQVTPGSSSMRSDNVGVVFWQAPEVRKPPYDPLKIDVWSLGATVWEMAQQDPPFADTQQFAERWPPLRQPELYSPAFHDFLRMCSEPAGVRMGPGELLKSSFIVHKACGRHVVVLLLSQCLAIEKSIQEGA